MREVARRAGGRDFFFCATRAIAQNQYNGGILYMIPRPMPDPCVGCSNRQGCISSETYQCPRFSELFTQYWDETVTYLRQQLLPEKEG